MSNKKVALVTGATGQDGSYISELLLSKDYEVHCLVRRASSQNTARIDAFKSRLHLHYGDLADSETINSLMSEYHPDEVYNLAAQSQVGISFTLPESTSNVTALGVTRLLESIRKYSPNTRFYQASSSEMYGAADPPQNEHTPFEPRSPYACSKLYAYWMCRNFREGYNTFACNGILFNHESPRRGEMFVTRKITLGIADIIAGKAKTLSLGNLDAKRDWGFAPEYVEVMHKMLQQDKSDDYTIGIGETHTVQEFLDEILSYTGLSGALYLRSDPELFRPTDVRVLKADTTYAQKKLGWKPKIKFHDLAKIMMDADMRRVGLKPIGEGDEIIAKTFPNKWWIGD